MNEINILKNPIQHYAWGSHRAIADLLGRPSPSEKPEAELWMGAHPKAPSLVEVGGDWRPLDQLIEHSAPDILGKPVAERFESKLPFLFKVLAAETPLSIQAHPNLAQAKEGFARENSMGIPLTAPNRNYKDANHKPEIICAQTPFWALNGFRKIDMIVSLLEEINPSELEVEIRDLGHNRDSKGLKRFFSTIMLMEAERQRRAVAAAVDFAGKHAAGNPLFQWMLQLNAEYPGDIGVLSPVLLNLIELRPSQAMFLHAGQLHAYLEGVGIELMANSDNVLRGGLTPKHIDVPELLKTLSFDETQIAILEPESRANGERTYETEVDEFRLSVVAVGGDDPYLSPENRSVEIMLCTSGGASIKNLDNNESLSIEKGTSLLVPSAIHQYFIEGDAILHKASVP